MLNGALHPLFTGKLFFVGKSLLWIDSIFVSIEAKGETKNARGFPLAPVVKSEAEQAKQSYG